MMKKYEIYKGIYLFKHAAYYGLIINDKRLYISLEKHQKYQLILFELYTPDKLEWEITLTYGKNKDINKLIKTIICKFVNERLNVIDFYDYIYICYNKHLYHTKIN